MTGTVYLVGAGPGATDLLTLRAARLLESADIVFHDALVPHDTLALAKHAQLVAVGKRCGRHTTAQRFINKRLIDAARRYPVVVRLKGGDPLLFGRAQEEIVALEAAGITYEVVPGITAALAAAAVIGTSLSQRGTVRSVALATPRVGSGEHASDWVRGFIAADAGAIYMGIGEAPAIAAALLANGKPKSLPVAVVENASLSNQRIVYTTLEQLPTLLLHEFAGPTLLLVGPQFAARDAIVQDAGAERCRPPKAAQEKYG
ncbi:MAG TPA: uroporphyrinogen-III C-methyltransferase [Casimicrobiaceae bacterium]|jgi:uroporphyrin-III C-methyltransferase